MNDLKVALISHEFPPYMFGGISSNCHDLAHSLSKKGVATTVFCGKSQEAYIEKINECLKVVRLPCLDIPPRFLWFQLQNFKILLRLLQEHTIIHCVNPLSSAMSIVLKSKLNKPTVVSIHEIYSQDLRTFINSPFSEWSLWDFCQHVLGYPLNEISVRSCLKSSDHIVVCGYSTRNELVKSYQSLDLQKISVIYNGIDFDKINRIENPSPRENDDSIIYYGRLIWRKGIFYLVKALSLLTRDFPDLKLRIFGMGPLEHKIRTLSTKLNLSDNVDFCGHAPYGELIGNIKKSNVVVLPSLYEVGPFISALEAMACKKPLVVFDLPFTREFVSNMHNGIMVKTGDVKDLSEKISSLLHSKNLCRRLGENAHESIRKKHNWDVLVDRYLNIYKSLI